MGCYFLFMHQEEEEEEAEEEEEEDIDDEDDDEDDDYDDNDDICLLLNLIGEKENEWKPDRQTGRQTETEKEKKRKSGREDIFGLIVALAFTNPADSADTPGLVKLFPALLIPQVWAELGTGRERIRPLRPECQSYQHVCYFTNWSQFGPRDRRLPPSRVPSNLCTHLIFAYANVRNTSIEPTEYNDFNTTMRLAETRVMVFLHGLCVAAHYKGTIRKNFREESRNNGRTPLILSAALEADIDDARVYYQIKAVGSLLDFACLMAYDMHGYWNLTAGAQHHSPLLPEIRAYIRGWLEAGFPASKLVMAVSASGRSFTLTSAPTGTGLGQPVSGPGQVGERSVEEGLLDYGEICENLDTNTWRRQWLPGRGVPVAMGNTSDGWQWVGYDDPESFAQKAAFVKTHSLAGVALWSLEHDDFNNECGQGRWPLLGTLWNTLNPPTSIPPPTTNSASKEPKTISTRTTTASTTTVHNPPDISAEVTPPTEVTNSFLAYPRLDDLEPGVKEQLRKNPIDTLWTPSPWADRVDGNSPRDGTNPKLCRMAERHGSAYSKQYTQERGGGGRDRDRARKRQASRQTGGSEGDIDT
ncbi:hypothetical protein EGW08_001668 [Elysia chlorotica]|uniref:GH18 domain-containing protein n=1 Tax=Elysia chlorotica TaxID=188477 RepID=A0A3S0ZZJ1_ELYCH|nr:hypothetical protein EGW08_001668 [Elysia chlorotica]